MSDEPKKDAPRFADVRAIKPTTLDAYDRGVMSHDQMAELFEACGQPNAARQLRKQAGLSDPQADPAPKTWWQRFLDRFR